MKSEFYKHGFDQGMIGNSMQNPYELPENRAEYESGWVDGITAKLEDLLNQRRAKLLDKSS